MAIQQDTQITGTIGDVIFYKWKDKHLSRAKGKTGTQAEVAKQHAAQLGKASAISARLRASFKPFLPSNPGRTLMYRLNNALLTWLRTGAEKTTEPLHHIATLDGFSFEDNGYIGGNFIAALPVSRVENDQLTLRIPTFDSPNPISPLPFEGQINFKVIVVSCNLQTPAETVSGETVLNIEYNGYHPETDLVLPLKTKPGHLTVVAVSINGMAAGIVKALYN